MLYPGLELKTSDLNLITWSEGAFYCVALITSSFASNGLPRASLRMFAEGRYVMQQHSGLGYAEATEWAIVATACCRVCHNSERV